MARIVHIEDDPANRLLVRKLLGRAGHEVLDAADGIEGVRLACESSPDLVLVDLNIPGLDGFEVTLRLRGEAGLAGVPIVAITAEGDRDTSLSVGCDGFLQKPIDARTFAATIAKYLGGAKEAPPPQRNTRLREQSQRIVAHLEQKVAELMKANERLREADAARAAFYRNVSHELATPMTPIVGYVRLLLDEELGELQPPQRRALGAMEECVSRLRRIIDNLLDALILAGSVPQAAGQSFHVSDGPVTWRDWMAFYGRMAGRRPRSARAPPPPDFSKMAAKCMAGRRVAGPALAPLVAPLVAPLAGAAPLAAG